jgi:beta-catenin-like protein 1
MATIGSAPEVPLLDEAGVKRMLVAFEKKLSKNAQMRVDFAGTPEKYMDSEIELDDEIKRLEVIATVPHLYPVLLKANTTESLIGLLAHDNSDIALEVIHLIKEMTDPEV